MKKIILSAAAIAMAFGVSAQTSPNGKVKAVETDKGIIVSYNSKKVMTIDTKVDSKSTETSGMVSYKMLLGKKSNCTNAYKEATYSLTDGSKLVMRVYNDGVAYKTDKASTVNMSACENNWLMRWSDSYEDFFPKNRTQKEGERYGYPALFEYTGGVWALLTESNMESTEAATSMYATDRTNVLSLRPDGQEEPGWQTLIVGSLSDIVESTLVLDNSAPNKLTDTSWIQPGVASWVYWAYNHGSNDYNIIKKYTDMAVELKLPYVLIDAEWDEMDRVASNGDKRIEDAVKYAVDKGIKPIIWYNSSVGWINGAPGPKFRLNKPEDREKEFAWCEKIGVSGVKIDFFSGDTNLNIKYMIELLECAAKHHLLVNFHGATIPRGWQRTYPNLVSTEGIYGAEWYNNKPIFTKAAASHNATIPFTRNVVGSMDYTPCAFSDSQYPHITTNAHELALTALYESGIQHLADRPESFLAQPQEVKDFLSNLPTAWDETLLLEGYPGKSVVIARRKGSSWYISGINGTDHVKTVTFSLDRLNGIGKNITIFADGDSKESPWKITEATSVPTILTLHPRGGFVMVIKK